MINRRLSTSLIAFGVILAGSAYLATPARAERPYPDCSPQQQATIAAMITAVCQGGTGWASHYCNADGSITLLDWGCD